MGSILDTADQHKMKTVILLMCLSLFVCLIKEGKGRPNMPAENPIESLGRFKRSPKKPMATAELMAPAATCGRACGAICWEDRNGNCRCSGKCDGDKKL